MFVYNPDDPFINPADVESTMSKARDVGVDVVSEPIPGVEHVQALFKQPNAIWANV